MAFTKKFSFLFISLFPVFSLSANYSRLFCLDEEKIYSAFNQVNGLEDFLWENNLEFQGKVSDMKNPEAQQILQNNGDSISKEIPIFGIPSFYWGFVPGFIGGFFAPCSYGGSCALGLSGVFGLYLASDQNKEETKKSIYGCAGGTALGTVTSVTLFILFYGYLLYSL